MPQYELQRLFWMFTLNKTSQEFSYINFIIRYSLITMNYLLYNRRSLVSLIWKKKKNTEDKFLNFDEMKHVSIVHVCSCLFCKKKTNKKRTILPCVLCLINIRALPADCCKSKLQFPIRWCCQGVVVSLLFAWRRHDCLCSFSGDV